MTRVSFIGSNGSVTVAEGPPGARLLDVAQAAGQPLEGTCNGCLACATCHVIVAREQFECLPPPSAEEEDMLDLVPDAVRTSRLSCQVVLSEELDELTVRIPG
ncbi:2Fe-2S iron-sulfur cluster-binding protein [Sphingomonas aracearum]|uniref:2Fe-2S ferredoxin n=1 Tax=Sphingomonas aracearum TaxID=2283317 RepID=A0A369VVL4_9SPHN|nr:2Fe-2S iron-sulfur cluster-binding protein [Sphingomonas aracearum]RDE06436.1 2Fe-2S ferredoxin [Sphingomonas aracearum]